MNYKVNERNKMRINIYEPQLTIQDQQMMIEAIKSGWVSSLGPFVEKFEKQFSDYTQIKFCSSCCNGTVALHLALLTLGIESGKKVGVPSFICCNCKRNYLRQCYASYF